MLSKFYLYPLQLLEDTLHEYFVCGMCPALVFMSITKSATAVVA